MKKKLSLLLCVLAAVLSIAGCGSKEETVEYDEASMEQVTEFLIEYCSGTDAETRAQWDSVPDFTVEEQLVGSGLPISPDSFRSALEAWETGIEECGEYIGHGDYSYEASRTDIEITTDAQFENRDATLIFIFEADLRGNLSLDSMTVNAAYSTGEIAQKAALNTLLGMGTVFAVLIIISLIISLFRFVPALQNAFTRKPKEAAEAEKAEEVLPETVNVATEDNGELVAVIAAAVAAAEGTGTDGFVVRSIRRRPSNKWSK